MSTVIHKTIGHCSVITLNRPEKHNAFDEDMIARLTQTIEEASRQTDTSCLILNATGKHFCAGADLNWMKKMADFSEQENVEDALSLSRLLKALYQSPKVTLCLCQGKALGGGAGLVAACDFALCEKTAAFAFTEIHLGLVPAVISPYVIDSLGAKQSKKLFLTGELFKAEQAKAYGLIDDIVEEASLKQALAFAETFKRLDPSTIASCKALVQTVRAETIDDKLNQKTAEIIASVRKSPVAQHRMNSFLNKS